MAQISPLVPLRYNLEMISSPGNVIAPPYDVITEAMHRELIARDPANVIRLILPQGEGDIRYANASALFTEWIEQGMLVEEPSPALYPYSQTFRHPRTGGSVERRGFIAAVGLEPFERGIILPHERTLSGPKEDRMKLMEATDANLEAIFGIYRDANGTSSNRLAEFMAAETPLIDAVDSDGVEHRLWRATDQDFIDEMTNDLSSNSIFIVDGHHRYETALAYRDRRRKERPDLPADSPVDSIMMFLAPTSDPGLLILPTHRVIHSLADFSFAGLLKELQTYFVLEEFNDQREAELELSRRTGQPAYLLLAGDSITLVSLRPDVRADELVGTDLPEALRLLDVTILHEYILEQLLGITKEAQAAQSNLRYVKNSEDAAREAASEDVQLVVLMNPTRLDQLEAVAGSGEVMPQKSTYVYPKLASGLLFRQLDSR